MTLLPNFGVNSNLTSLGALLLILTALILRTIFDSELLQGGMQDFGKTLNVQAVTTNQALAISGGGGEEG